MMPINRKEIINWIVSLLYVLFLISPSWNYYIINNFFGPFLFLLTLFQFILIGFPFFSGLISRRTFFVMTTPFLIATLFQRVHISIYSYELLSGGISAILSTNIAEAGEFFNFFKVSTILQILIIISLFLIGIFLPNYKIKKISIPKTIALFLIFLSIPSLKLIQTKSISKAVSMTFGKSYPFKTFYELKKAKTQLANFKTLLSEQDFLTLNPDCSKVSDNENIVVLIGESSSKHHWQLYNSQVKTTPLLAKNDQIILFSDVVSASNATIQSLQNSITIQVQNKMATILTLANECGYETHWYSNQAKFGEFDTLTTLIAYSADHHHFINTDTSNASFDEALLPYLKKSLASSQSKKMIVLHTMGSHYFYERRYPKSFNQNPINADDNLKTTRTKEYNNTIRYTDFVLDGAIKEITNNETPSALIYFSDHGENVFHSGSDYHGHGMAKFHVSEVEVPMLFYANKSYSRMNPNLVDHVRKARTRKLSLNDTFSNIANLLKISYLNRKELFPNEDKRIIQNLNGEKFIYHEIK